ncbi:MAG: ribonuclease III, partial [Candidatus Aenigmarchaeota archaeon]|nr:ribonuclease III [Candidatus Aenigmarchaeota archaeon]
ERLEFLGDAVLELISSDFLFKHYHYQEGDLTSLRASLVNTNSLAKLANELKLDDFLFLSKGERKNKQNMARKCILADTLEAIIGALYLDQGLSQIRKFLEKNLFKNLPQIISQHSYRDAKTKFQEDIQHRFKITPHYQVLKEWGPEHAKNFCVAVFIADQQIARGTDKSKHLAELSAAKYALSKEIKSINIKSKETVK